MVTFYFFLINYETLIFFMVSSFLKFEHRFPFFIFGHYKCPKMKSRKKSLKKKRYKTINPERGLKNYYENLLSILFNKSSPYTKFPEGLYDAIGV